MVRDDLVTGLAVRKTATGCTAFVFNYVANGVERRLTIGRYPAWSVSAARDHAKALRRSVDMGNDPLADREKARAEPTLRDLWVEYKKAVLSGKAESTQRNVASMWERLILPGMGNVKLSRITSQTVDRLHRELSVSTPVQANRCMATLRHAFNKAIRWNLLSKNPVAGVEANTEANRERYLTADEASRLLAALDARGENTSTLAIRFLLLTGARSGEVFRATWDQFDLDHGVWVKPSSHTKQRRIHRVPLSTSALEVLGRASAFRGHVRQ